MVGCICLYLLYGLLSAIFLSGISLDSYFFVRWVTAVSSVDRNILKSILPTSETWCNIGDYYKNRGVYSMAVEYYRKASFMVPTRIMPNYKLWKLYMEKGNYRMAVEYANKILVMPLKVENTITLGIKGEVMRSMKEHSMR